MSTISQYAALLCPSCGGSYLHQDRIISCNRRYEDTRTEYVRLDGVEVELLPEGHYYKNPSGRRSGLIVEFTCETCHCEPDPNIDEQNNVISVSFDDSTTPPYQLAIYQHKGNTFMEWLVPDMSVSFED